MKKWMIAIPILAVLGAGLIYFFGFNRKDVVDRIDKLESELAHYLPDGWEVESSWTDVDRGPWLIIAYDRKSMEQSGEYERINKIFAYKPMKKGQQTQYALIWQSEPFQGLFKEFKGTWLGEEFGQTNHWIIPIVVMRQNKEETRYHVRYFAGYEAQALHPLLSADGQSEWISEGDLKETNVDGELAYSMLQFTDDEPFEYYEDIYSITDDLTVEYAERRRVDPPYDEERARLVAEEYPEMVQWMKQYTTRPLDSIMPIGNSGKLYCVTMQTAMKDVKHPKFYIVEMEGSTPKLHYALGPRYNYAYLLKQELPEDYNKDGYPEITLVREDMGIDDLLYPQKNYVVLSLRPEEAKPLTPIGRDYSSAINGWCKRGTIGFCDRDGDGILEIFNNDSLGGLGPLTYWRWDSKREEYIATEDNR